MKKTFSRQLILSISLRLAALTLALPFLHGQALESYPEATLSNAWIKARIYLPDAERGFVRGPRYDTAGIVGRVETKGHSYFVNFLNPHDPTASGAAAGLIDEFRLPVGYEDSPAGGSFGKIGVGLVKKESGEYNFGRHYQVERFAPWTISSNGDSITFTQEFSFRSWGWRFEKTIALDPRSASLTIHHRLKNTGSLAFSNSHYNHNFISIDGEKMGPDYRAAFNFYTICPQADTNEVLIEKNLWQVRSDFAGKSGNLFNVRGFEYVRGDPAFLVHNRKKDAGVAISIHGPIREFFVFIHEKAFCPEPFVAIQLEPGAETSWDFHYRFFEGPMKVPPIASLDDRAYHGVRSIFLDKAPLTTFQISKTNYTVALPQPAALPRLSAESFNPKDRVLISNPGAGGGDGIVSLIPWDKRVGETVYRIRFRSTDGVLPKGSAEKPGFESLNTLDGDPETRWTANGTNQWLVYDLGKPRTLKGMAFIWGSGESRKAFYEIQLSLDATNWNAVFSGASSGTIKGMETNVFGKPAPARYVKYLGNGNSINLWNNLAEVQFLFE